MSQTPVPAMDSSSRVGRVRNLSDSERDEPPSKRPRTEALTTTTTGPAEPITISEAANLTKKTNPKRDRKRENKRKKQQAKLPDPCSSEDVLWKDIVVVLGQEYVENVMAEGVDYDSPFSDQEEVELEVKMLGSNGDGVAVAKGSIKPWVVIVPMALPNEIIRARIYRQGRLHSFGDFLEVVTANDDLRDPSRIRCKYFGTCGGCQYQMLSYETQLEFKRNVVVKAFKNYSNLLEGEMPVVLPTAPSPLQYEYRTKLTPHFEAPPKGIRKNIEPLTSKPDWLHIGFNRVGTQKVMDIEECPIATPIINTQMTATREDVVGKVHTYKKGVSLLFRDSLDTCVNIDDDSMDRLSESFNKHICVTNPKAVVRERVGDWIFEYNGASFFQNNNAVLLPLTTYVRDAIFPPASPNPSTLTHLVDTYCGAGLFGIVLSPSFQKVAGIELSQDSIRSATRNAQLNKISPQKISFRAGNAGEIFAVVTDFPKNETAVLIDPPRKGCDEFFIKQLLEFAPKTIVYVSCNVHTQARDIGQIMDAGRAGSARYTLESVRGFDLFPQTAHVESVAVLNRVS